MRERSLLREWAPYFPIYIAMSAFWGHRRWTDAFSRGGTPSLLLELAWSMAPLLLFVAAYFAMKLLFRKNITVYTFRPLNADEIEQISRAGRCDA